MATPITPNDFLNQLQAYIIKNNQDAIAILVQEQQETSTLVQNHLLSLPNDTPQVDTLRQLGDYLFDLNASVLADAADDDIDIQSVIKTDIVMEPLKKSELK